MGERRARFPKRKEASSAGPAVNGPTHQPRQKPVWFCADLETEAKAWRHVLSPTGRHKYYAESRRSKMREPRQKGTLGSAPGVTCDGDQNSPPRLFDPPRVIWIPRWRTWLKHLKYSPRSLVSKFGVLFKPSEGREWSNTG